MRIHLLSRLFVVSLAAGALAACVRGDAMPAAGHAAYVATPVLASTASKAVPASTLPLMVVHKHESCGCCGAWIEHMQQAGFIVQVRNVPDVSPIKARLGVPAAMASCHTGEVGGYFVEGHVPAADVKRLLKEKPVARGLAVPGMPLGSPGMEHPGGRSQAYSVELVSRDGSSSGYSRYPAK